MTEEQAGYEPNGMDPHTSMIMLAVLNRGLGIRRIGKVFVIYAETDRRDGLFSLEQWDRVEARLAEEMACHPEGHRTSLLRLTASFLTQHCRWSGNYNGLVEIDEGRLERFILVHTTFIGRRWDRPEWFKFVNEGVYPAVAPAAAEVK